MMPWLGLTLMLVGALGLLWLSPVRPETWGGWLLAGMVLTLLLALLCR